MNPIIRSHYDARQAEHGIDTVTTRDFFGAPGSSGAVTPALSGCYPEDIRQTLCPPFLMGVLPKPAPAFRT